MRKVDFTDIKKILVIEAPMPEIMIEDEVKIKVQYCSFCGDDIAIIEDTQRRNKRQLRYIGQLFSGTIVDLGVEATKMGFVKGDSVSGHIWNFCGKCPYCRRGKENLCMDSSSSGGAFQEYVVYKANQLCVLPSNVSMQNGCFVSEIAACIHGIRRAGIDYGKKVLILGAGAIGLNMMQLAKMHGGVQVTVIEPIESRRRLASALGADFVLAGCSDREVLEIMRITEYLGYDVILDASRNIHAVEESLGFLAKGGCILINSLFKVEDCLNIDLSTLYAKECSILTTYMSAYTLNDAVSFINRLHIQDLIGPEYELENVQKAFDDFIKKRYPRVMVRISPDKKCE